MKDILPDLDLADLPEPLRWREWMARAEAYIFASPHPVGRLDLARVVGRACPIDPLIEDIRHALSDRPYELVEVATGYQFRTRPRLASFLRPILAGSDRSAVLSKTDMLVLTAVGYLQPLTRAAISEALGQDISRDSMARLKAKKLIANGPRAPQPGAPTTYVTTDAFLELFGLATLQDLPEREALRAAPPEVAEVAGDNR